MADTQKKASQISKKLRNLFSLITHAEKVEEEMESLVTSLRTCPTNSSNYILSTNLLENLSYIREIFSSSNDIQIREFLITPLQTKGAIVFIEGMSDKEIISSHIIKNLTSMTELPSSISMLDYLKNTLLTAPSIMTVDTMEQVINQILSGDTALFVEGLATGIIVATRKVEFRAISEPQVEAGLRGPQDSFTEELSVNITLLRRRIMDENLVVKRLKIGERSQTAVAMVYFRGIVNPNLVSKVEHRLVKIKVDSPGSRANIEKLIQDHPLSPFPTVFATERPDRLTTGLLQGKVAIIQDGTPYCLIVPGVLSDFFKSGDDYYDNWFYGSLIRITRYAAAVIALITPALYVAITTYNPGFIPASLATTLGSARQGLPFPAIFEALLMETFLEIMQEAGLRLPKPIGPAVSIVGGLIIGDSAARAGIVSLPMIVVIGVTAIASFSMSSYRIALPLRLLRVPIMVLAATLGMFGLEIGLIIIIIHLSMLESFGEPYLAPFVPRNFGSLYDLQDTVIAEPQSTMHKRPAYLETLDNERQEQ